MRLGHQLLLVSIVLEAWIFSLVLSSEMLPEKEMRELDIFMQDGEYYEISRTKRTENGTSEDGQEETEGSAMEDQKMMGPPEEEASGEITLDVTTTPVDSNHPTSTTQAAISKNEGNGAAPFASAELSTLGPTSQIDDSADDLSMNGPENQEETDQTTTDLKDQPSTEPPSVTAEDATEQSDVEDTFADPLAEPETENPDLVEQELRSRSGEFPVDVSDTTSFNASETDIYNSEPEIPAAVATTPNIPEDIPDTGLVQIITEKNQYEAEVNNTINHNTTKTDIKGAKLDTPGAGEIPLTTTVKSVANVSNTPRTGESDLSNKSSVSGSGVLFTIIAIIGIAGLAAAGYYIYKKRQQGYDPVAIEERDKEMTEVTTGNGFGKPICAEEIKLNDQLTPIEPKAAPRTFALTPPDEAPLENVEVVKEDNENRDKREQSVEFEEEANKKDEQ